MKALLPMVLLAGCGLGFELRPALEGQPELEATDGAVEQASFLALGDSYTIGQSVAEAERWPTQLAELVGAEAPQIVARTGWTVAELGRGIDEANPTAPQGLVTLLIGVNDQFRGGTPEAYRPAFRATLRRAIGFAGAACRVLVLSIPDYGNTPFGRRRAAQIGAELDAFNAVAEEEVAAMGAAWVSVTEISREADPGLVASDGLHPSGAQYARWAEAAAPAARAALSCR